MSKEHRYQLNTEWTGNTGSGTSGYRQYERAHVIRINNKPDLAASSDPSFRGDPQRHNPEELLVASISSCHMLWYLHLCAEAGVVLTTYLDHATGIMAESPDGGGKFREVLLDITITVAHESMVEKATALHKRANELCFISNSVNFPVHHRVSVNLS